MSDGEHTMDDELASLRAAMDQQREGMVEVAKVAWVFYKSALEEGFTEEQAFALAQAWLVESVRGAMG